MIFHSTKLSGSDIIHPEKREDERGFFARSWCRDEFTAQGLNPNLVQCNVSFNRKKGTLRGLHYQVAPHAEAKVLRCTSGAAYAVALDLRPASATYRQWHGVILSRGNYAMLFAPEGFATGFQTLENDTEIFYQMSDCFHPESARGVRWDDPAFNIEWPEEADRTMAPRDRDYPDFAHADFAP